MASKIKTLLVRIGGDSKGIERAGVRAAAVLKRVQTSAASLARGVGRLAAVAGALTFAGKRLFLDKFAEQGEAVATLRAALVATGKDGEDALRLITDEASRLQLATKTGDEALIKATATLAQLAPSLNADELARGQKALIGIANVFTRGDVGQAALQLGKSLSSNLNALARYGIQISDVAAPASEKLAEILGNKGLAAAFQVAQAQAQTYQGRSEQLVNATGDLREVIGSVIVGGLDLSNRFKDLTDKTLALHDSIAANEEKWRAWLRVSVGAVVAVAKAFGGLVRVAFEVGQMIGRAFDVAFFSLVVAGSWAVNKVIGFLNRIPGVDIGTIPLEGMIERLAIQTEGLGADWETVKGIIERNIRAFGDLGAAAGRASLASGPSELIELQGVAPVVEVEDVSEVSARMLELQRIASRAFSSTRTAAEKLQIEIDELSEAFMAGALDGETYSRAVAAARANFQKTIPVVRDLREVGVEFATDFAVQIANATADGFDSFRQFADLVGAELKRLAIKFAIFQGLKAIFGGGGIVGAIGQSFGFVSGGRAHGGPIFPGQRVRVGERGAEDIVAPTAGRVRRSDELTAAAAPSSLSLALEVVLATESGRRVVDAITSQQQLDTATKRTVQASVPAAVLPLGRT